MCRSPIPPALLRPGLLGRSDLLADSAAIRNREVASWR
jgi:hypothetical protein